MFALLPVLLVLCTGASLQPVLFYPLQASDDINGPASSISEERRAELIRKLGTNVGTKLFLTCLLDFKLKVENNLFLLMTNSIFFHDITTILFQQEYLPLPQFKEPNYGCQT